MIVSHNICGTVSSLHKWITLSFPDVKVDRIFGVGENGEFKELNDENISNFQKYFVNLEGFDNNFESMHLKTIGLMRKFMTTGTLDMDVKMEYDWEEGRRFDFVDFCGEIVFEVCGVGGARVFQSGDERLSEFMRIFKGFFARLQSNAVETKKVLESLNFQIANLDNRSQIYHFVSIRSRLKFSFGSSLPFDSMIHHLL
ncbi:hypothetical protein ROZALSC1DRAFT_20415 [Rozella allomycis CSF55]|uniref:Uncharacterized protein n=1 Tax=Rozella allomycis (strain CSF55) TaxID=988480 RepID=A0A4P9YPV9_ROZAC|nr:hypothetical protein ROZALSC1DRAFT_20415 [Rozella allomycis CSF55]